MIIANIENGDSYETVKGKTVSVGISERGDFKFLKTDKDDTELNNLGSLPAFDCQ